MIITKKQFKQNRTEIENEYINKINFAKKIGFSDKESRKIVREALLDTIRGGMN